jgi:hypothetical protein
MKLFKSLLSIGLLSIGVQARSPMPTLELTEVEKTIESVEDMRSFYNGSVRFFLHNNEEPAARPMEITVVLPNGQQEGFIDLKTLSVSWFCSANLKAAKSTYNSKDGLTVAIPVGHYIPETGSCDDKDTLNVNVKMLEGSKSSAVAWLSSGRQ